MLRELFLDLPKTAFVGVILAKFKFTLQKVDDRVGSAILVIGRTAALHPATTLRRGALLKHLHQAGFAYARLTAQQYDLPLARLSACPSLSQQAQFAFSSDQRCQPALNRHIKPALSLALMRDSID